MEGQNQTSRKVPTTTTMVNDQAVLANDSPAISENSSHFIDLINEYGQDKLEPFVTCFKSPLRFKHFVYDFAFNDNRNQRKSIIFDGKASSNNTRVYRCFDSKCIWSVAASNKSTMAAQDDSMDIPEGHWFITRASTIHSDNCTSPPMDVSARQLAKLSCFQEMALTKEFSVKAVCSQLAKCCNIKIDKNNSSSLIHRARVLHRNSKSEESNNGDAIIHNNPKKRKTHLSSSPLHVVTPLLESLPIGQKYHEDTKIWLKLENTQPAGSFKTRGVGNACVKAIEKGKTHLVSSSGGNAGLAVAYAARKLCVPATVFVPSTTPTYMQERLRMEGASVVVAGDVWDEANVAALNMVNSDSSSFAYISPFDHPDIWSGNATVIDEISNQLEVRPDLIVVAVGGGGFFSGICQGIVAHGWEKDVKVLAIETVGSNALEQSVTSGELVTLDSITSIAKSLGAKRVAERAFSYSKSLNVVTGSVTDAQAAEACLAFANDHKFLIEPACGAALAPVYNPSLLKSLLHNYCPTKLGNIVVMVCGGNMTSPTLQVSAQAATAVV